MEARFNRGHMRDVLAKVKDAVVHCGAVRSVEAADRKLEQWAKKINGDFEARREQKRLDYLRKTPEGQELLLLNEKYGEQKRKFEEMATTVDGLTVSLGALRSDNTKLHAEVRRSNENVETLLALLSSNRHRQQTASSPLSASSPSDLSSITAPAPSSATPRAIQLGPRSQQSNNNAKNNPASTNRKAPPTRPPPATSHQPPSRAAATVAKMMNARGTKKVRQVESGSGAKYYIHCLVKDFHREKNFG